MFLCAFPLSRSLFIFDICCNNCGVCHRVVVKGNVTVLNEHDAAIVKVQNGEHDDGGSMCIGNVGTYLLNHVASHNRSQPFS
jgi:hypothetical protein